MPILSDLATLLRANAWHLLWLIPLWLFILAVFQFVYLTFIRYAPTRKEAPAPSSPIMPVVYAPPDSASQTSTNLYPQQGSAQQGYSSVGQMPVMQQSLPPGYINPPPLYGYPPPPQPGYGYMPPHQQPMEGQMPPYGQQPPPYGQQPPPQPVAAPRMSAAVGKFIVLSGLPENHPKDMAFPSAEFVIGRFLSPENNVLIALDEKSISRRHAVLTCDEATREYYLRDTNSSFGTSIMINGVFEPLTPEKQERIYNEDVIQFGNVVTVRVLIPSETRASLTNLG